jgi:hypothetical protein
MAKFVNSITYRERKDKSLSLCLLCVKSVQQTEHSHFCIQQIVEKFINLLMNRHYLYTSSRTFVGSPMSVFIRE